MNSSTVKTWRERIGQPADFPLHAPTDVERAMEEEIAELRSMLAQSSNADSAPTMPGAVRAGFGEAPPRGERRRYPEAGLE
jgi:hypothetical protein